jgi:hypothetical protein
VESPPQPAPEVVKCPSGYLDVSGGKVATRQTSGDLYAVDYRGTLTNNTSADVFMSRSDPPDVYALADDGEVITIVSRGNFETAKTDGTPVPEDFVLKPGQSVPFHLFEDSRVIEREVSTWFDTPRVGQMTAEWNDADIYRCSPPLRPAN